MNAWPVIGILILIFALWVSTGGPDRPISFAGPFITPITDVKDVQVGYGEGIDTSSGGGSSGSSLWSVKSVFGRFEGAVGNNEAAGPVSPFADKVTISSGAGGPGGSSASQEYVVLRGPSEGTVDITGWSLVSMKSGAAGTIPAGTIAPRAGGGAPISNVVLSADEEAIITTGASPVGQSFRENKCTAYFDTGNYVPSLSNHSCPSPDEELGDFYRESASSYESCRRVVDTLPACETQRTAPREASASCESFIESRLSYPGCVSGHFNDEDFRGDTWRVYLGKSRELWRSDNETIKLLDREGRTVDIYSY
ncbi:MAG TPA: hypothetical protein VGB97_03835 [Candidatus Paceibacterota bacterium]|jgi:hypothetical protein